MINFSSFRGPFAQRLRMLAHLVPRDAQMRVLQGPLRGARWIAGASNAGCWLGSYESEVQAAMTAMVGRGDVVYDVGANVGFFTLLASRLVGGEGHVYAFEPMPANAGLLRRHLELNQVSNVELLEAAVSERDGELRFAGRDSGAHIHVNGETRVRALALDPLWRSGALRPPTLIKMDVEGAELPALRGMRELLVRHRPRLLIEFHGARNEGPDDDSVSLALLREIGYSLRTLSCGETVGEFA